MAKAFAFGKREKLKSRKEVEALFATGKVVSSFPLRIYYHFVPVETQAESNLQVGVTVGKRYFKKAADRNRIKRLLREAYRLQKKTLTDFLAQNSLKGNVFFIYTDKTLPPFTSIYDAIGKSLQTLQKRAGKTNEKPS